MAAKNNKKDEPANADKAKPKEGGAAGANDPEAADAGASGGNANNGEKPKSYSQSEVDRLVANAAKEAEKKAKEAEERAKLGEVERANAEKEDLRRQLAERDARDAVTAEATKMGAANPSAVYKIVKDDLETDDNGKITNLSGVFEQVKAEFPELFQKKAADPGAADGGAGADQKPVAKFTREQIKEMSASEINKNWDAVQASLEALK